jgi:hypothetical protein
LYNLSLEVIVVLGGRQAFLDDLLDLGNGMRGVSVFEVGGFGGVGVIEHDLDLLGWGFGHCDI